MSQKYVVVQGALCTCKFGDFPDALKVKSHQKYYANDPSASQKLIATTKELGGSTFQANTFGTCKLQPRKSGFKPCRTMVAKWTGFYKDADLGNGGQVLIEDSKAICPIAGSPCISVLHHGQTMIGSVTNVQEKDEDLQRQMNPMVASSDLSKDENEIQEISIL